ncbi:MAG: LysR family transcriptional regulator [Deltaproteobacteria bacterium]|nr:LysR family transcriptional regulator [Deltaproteobacteria bacterium]
MNRLLAMQVFARVVECGSFTNAAASLKISRARTSEAVQDLEAILNTRLLYRTTRQLSLTDDGRAYYARVRSILAEIDEAESEIGKSPANIRGRLRAVMPIALTKLFVLPMLPELLQKHPELELEIRLENRRAELLREGFDCAVTYGSPYDQELAARKLAKTRLLTCGSPSYFLKHPYPNTPNMLNEHNCILVIGPQTGEATPWEFQHGQTRIIEKPIGNLAFNSMEACIETACMGLGLIQVLSSVAFDSIRQGRLIQILADYTCNGPSLYFAYPPNRQASARLRIFGDFLKNAFSQFDVD